MRRKSGSGNSESGFPERASLRGFPEQPWQGPAYDAKPTFADPCDTSQNPGMRRVMEKVAQKSDDLLKGQ